MADNTSITPGVGAKVASDEVSYSGDTASVQLVRVVETTGAEGSKTVLASGMGTQADASATTDTGTFSLIALFKRALGYLSTIATNAASTAASPVELGPFTPIYLTSGTNAAVQTTTAAAGDYLQHVILQPTTTSPGAFTLYDGSTGGTNSVKYSHPGGSSSLSNLAPIVLAFTANCVNAGWHITIVSGWNVTLVGKFS